jgi:hypothetical protein
MTGGMGGFSLYVCKETEFLKLFYVLFPSFDVIAFWFYFPKEGVLIFLEILLTDVIFRNFGDWSP